MLIGLSLSFCVRDIISNKVSPTEVDKIIAGTCASSEEEWQELLDDYSQTCWSTDPKRARTVANFFRDSGRLDQPRTRDKEPPDISQGHWLRDGELVQI